MQSTLHVSFIKIECLENYVGYLVDSHRLAKNDSEYLLSLLHGLEDLCVSICDKTESMMNDIDKDFEPFEPEAVAEDEHEEDDIAACSVIQSETVESAKRFLHDAYVGPFVDKTSNGRWSVGGIDDSIGSVITLDVEKYYVKEFHGHIIEDVVDILNGNFNGEWSGPVPSFDMKKKEMVCGFLKLNFVPRLGKSFSDVSGQLLNDVAYAVLEPEKYADFCCSCIVCENCFDVSDSSMIRSKNDFIGIIEWNIAKKIVHDNSLEERWDLIVPVLDDSIKNELNGVIEEFYGLSFVNQLDSDIRDDYSNRILSIVSSFGIDKSIIEDCLGAWYAPAGVYYPSFTLAYEFYANHKKEEGDIIIERVSLSKGCRAIVSFSDLEEIKRHSYGIRFYVVDLYKDGLYYRVFKDSVSYLRLGSGAITFYQFINDTFDYLNEVGVIEFAEFPELPIPIPKNCRHRVIDVAKYASANLFISCGIAITPGSIKSMLTALHNEQKENPNINVTNFLRNKIVNKISDDGSYYDYVVITKEARGDCWPEFSDEFISGIFMLECD